MKILDLLNKLLLLLQSFFSKKDPALSNPDKIDPNKIRNGKKVILRATKYYVALESEYHQKNKQGIFRDTKGNVLHRGSDVFKRAADIEGSCKLIDGRILNFWKRIDGDIRYKEIDAEFGLGVNNYKLVPFKSVAVDKSVVPYGSKLYSPKLAGRTINGQVHNGILFAHDTGGAIIKDRVDLFCGSGKWSMNHLNFIKHMEPLEIIILEK